VIKYRFNERTRSRLLISNWRNYNFAQFQGIDLDLEINEYLEALESRINTKQIKVFSAPKLSFLALVEESK